MPSGVNVTGMSSRPTGVAPAGVRIAIAASGLAVAIKVGNGARSFSWHPASSVRMKIRENQVKLLRRVSFSQHFFNGFVPYHH
jgi:hypothetical protein